LRFLLSGVFLFWHFCSIHTPGFHFKHRQDFSSFASQVHFVPLYSRPCSFLRHRLLTNLNIQLELLEDEIRILWKDFSETVFYVHPARRKFPADRGRNILLSLRASSSGSEPQPRHQKTPNKYHTYRGTTSVQRRRHQKQNNQWRSNRAEISHEHEVLPLTPC
jgi:hypothetical protein